LPWWKNQSPELQVSSFSPHAFSQMPQGVLSKIVGLDFVLMEQTHTAHLCEYTLKKN
jgi:hypothetical protein